MISSVGSAAMYRPDPKEFFKKVDSDGSGEVSQAELKTLAEKIQEKTGQTIDVSDEAVAGYDSDGSGSLSAEELKAVMENSGFSAPKGMEGMSPPPPPPQQAASSYEANATSADEDSLASLIDTLNTLLEKLSALAGSSSSDDSSESSSVAGSLAQASMTKTDGFFTEVDSDESGGISQDELKTLSENLSQMTGQTLDVSDDAFSSYDTDGDGSLSAEELKTAMEKNGFKPPPPPPGSMDGTTASDSDTSVLADQIAELKSLLQNLAQYSSSGSSTTSSLLSITS